MSQIHVVMVGGCAIVRTNRNDRDLKGGTSLDSVEVCRDEIEEFWTDDPTDGLPTAEELGFTPVHVDRYRSDYSETGSWKRSSRSARHQYERHAA
ncbi:MAG TPA: hypothetical protein QF873_03255 [Patescibacteria group bacterium]|nr:hypothetical protein [Patescibacteria group bacterium]